MIACALTLSGCSQKSLNAVEINQASAISIHATEVSKFSRVVALANGSAEIISALGQKKILIGRDIASTDKDLQTIPIVTSGHQVVSEKIIALKPDLVIIDASTGPAIALTQLKGAGIKVVTVSEIWSFEEIGKKISEVASAIGVTKDGQSLSSHFAGTTSKISQSAKFIFLYLRGTNAIYLMGGKGSGADSLIKAIGGVDVGAEHLAQSFNTMTAEAVASANPDVILVMTKGLESVGGMKGLLALPGVAQTEAGKRGRVIAVDDSLLLSFGPRTPDMLAQLSKATDEVMKR